MNIAGLQKTSLLDFPGKLCCTVFTDGCNLRCPFCHNSSLVLTPGAAPWMPEQEIFAFLEKRKGLLDGVCITGGEPLIQNGIEEFMIKIKKLGFLIKLDTNGTYPERLIELVDRGVIDYVAMDIKNSLEHYGMTAGIENFDTTAVEKSVAFLLKGKVSYEFRTTVVREYHTTQDFISIGRWIKGANHYFLQGYEDSEDVINHDLHAWDKGKMEEFRAILKDYTTNVELRGIV